MGSAMAQNLLRAGHSLTVYNRTRGKADPLASAGAKVAGSAGEAARDAEVAISMLADDQAAIEMALGDDGIAAGLPKGAIHISSSTIGTACSRTLAEAHTARGQRFLAAPVFGRPDAAAAARLVVVVGGEAEALERCRPIFDAVGRMTVVAGSQPWQANAVKLCGNFMLASMLETFGEAFATLRKAGVPPRAFLDAMNGLFASPVYAGYGGAIAEERYELSGFSLKLGAKDVRLVLEAGAECGAPMPIASLLRDQFLSAMAHGQSEMEWSSVAMVAARAAGL